jgi:hypothetical protein
MARRCAVPSIVAAIKVISEWASERRLVLGQRQVGDKSNVIAADPERLCCSSAY